MSEFIQHWTDLNTALGAPLELSDARNVAMLTTWLGQVETKIGATTLAIIAAANRKGELDVLKEKIIAWAVTFNATVRANHPESVYARKLVPAPQQSAGRGAFMEPTVQTQQLWMDLNDSLAADLELKMRRTLPNGSIATETLAMADYTQLIAEVQTKWNEWTRAQQKADNVREERNDVMTLAYDTMRDYRLRVPLELPPNHALLASLPALNPDPARSVTAPVASGTWNSTTVKADLTAVPSPDADVVRTELRFSPVDPYDTDNEIVLTSISAGGTLTFATDLGLAIPGDISRFTWVAVTADGHEGRSNVVAVART